MKGRRRRTPAVVATLVASLLIGATPAWPQPTSPTATEAARDRACEKALVRQNNAYKHWQSAKAGNEGRRKIRKWHRRYRRAKRAVKRECPLPPRAFASVPSR